jgi:catechol 2,3-dioxygenase-like lactoylglutathione lyase family enzyme
MRSVGFFAAGICVGLCLQAGRAQERGIVGLNHVSLAVENFEEATKFYTQVMGFPEAFAFRDANGPYLSYFQINRNTFIELMPVTPERPPGFVHFGLEVGDVDSVVSRLRAQGVQVGNASVSARTRSRVATATSPQGTRFELLEFGPESLHRKVIEGWRK